MPRTQPVPATNCLLEALPRKDRQRFLAGFLVFAEILAEPGEWINEQGAEC